MKTDKKTIILVIGLLLLAGCAAQQATEEAKQMGAIKLTSPAFQNGESIPEKYRAVNPELDIEGIPAGTITLALIMEDRDAPSGTFYHWILFNISPAAKIDENSTPKGAALGKNSLGKNGYFGPSPPSGTHTYIFNLYALDTALNLDESAGSKELTQAMKGHVLAQTKLTGLYSSNSK